MVRYHIVTHITPTLALHIVTLTLPGIISQKHWGLYQNKVKSSLTSTQTLGYEATTTTRSTTTLFYPYRALQLK